MKTAPTRKQRAALAEQRASILLRDWRERVARAERKRAKALRKRHKAGEAGLTMCSTVRPGFPATVTVYIAGPMTGLRDFNYPAFRRAARELAALGHEVLSPVDNERHNPTPGTPQPWDWYMRRALRMVLDADAVALLPGWEDSRGATLEHHVATQLGLWVRPLDDWLGVSADV